MADIKAEDWRKYDEATNAKPEPSPSVGAQTAEYFVKEAAQFFEGYCLPLRVRDGDHKREIIRFAAAFALQIAALAPTQPQPSEELARRIAEAQQEQNKAWIVACLKFLKPSRVIIPKGHDLSPEEILKMFLPPTGQKG